MVGCVLVRVGHKVVVEIVHFGVHGAEGHSQVIDAEVDQLLDYRDLVEMDLVQGHCGGVVLA